MTRSEEPDGVVLESRIAPTAGAIALDSARRHRGLRGLAGA